MSSDEYDHMDEYDHATEAKQYGCPRFWQRVTTGQTY